MEFFVSFTLFNINEFKIEREGTIDLSNKLNKKIKFPDNDVFEYIGVGYEFFTKFEIFDNKKFLSYIRSLIFKDSKIINCEGNGNGHPDFIIEKDGEKVYIEQKNGQDGLRLSQLDWFSKNKDKTIKILFLSKVISPDSWKFTPNEKGTPLRL